MRTLREFLLAYFSLSHKTKDHLASALQEHQMDEMLVIQDLGAIPELGIFELTNEDLDVRTSEIDDGYLGDINSFLIMIDTALIQSGYSVINLDWDDSYSVWMVTKDGESSYLALLWVVGGDPAFMIRVRESEQEIDQLIAAHLEAHPNPPSLDEIAPYLSIQR